MSSIQYKKKLKNWNRNAKKRAQTNVKRQSHMCKSYTFIRVSPAFQAFTQWTVAALIQYQVNQMSAPHQNTY